MVETAIDCDIREKIKKGIAVVDFFADWCSKCNVFMPVFEDVSHLFKDTVFVKADVDKCENFISEMDVMSLPTIIFFKDGIEVKRHHGSMTKQDLIDEIEGIK